MAGRYPDVRVARIRQGRPESDGAFMPSADKPMPSSCSTPKNGNRYGRVLLKLSGESFCKSGSFGIDAEEFAAIADEIKLAASLGVQIAVVVGGGNIIRVRSSPKADIHQATADHMGMLGR